MTDREDKYTIEWDVLAVGTPHESKYATITITELWGIGHIIFKNPLKVDVFFGNPDDGKALAVYDFGMDDEIPLAKERNWLYNYAGENDLIDPIRTVFSTIKFDLMHAFFHYQGDPNYSHTHWALYGNLKDRAEADDEFIFEDYELSQIKENGST